MIELVSHRAMLLHSGSKEFLSRVLRRNLVLRRMPLFSIICGQDSHYPRSQGYSSTPPLSIEATELPNLSASSYVTNPRSPSILDAELASTEHIVHSSDYYEQFVFSCRSTRASRASSPTLFE
jgi:hypothetical protein